ncbi:MAG TPA: aldo/keto reductase [Candidatus Dormibacteraeota bacterium]|nr:aldo/keto reductase [Candidatus Dormibacteraeota bacterium]
MELRPLGSSGLRVTPVGLGLAAVGRPGYITLDREKDLGSDRSVSSLERRAHDVLGAAYDAGIRYFDAARSYGFAERFLASWLHERALPPRAVTVGSKWGYTYVGNWKVDAPVHEVKDHSLAALRRQIDESRTLLGEYLDLYQIHSATLESGVLDDHAVLAELNSLRAGGLTIGMSVSGPHQSEVIRRALAVSVDGVNPFQSVQATWNLLEPSAGPALAEAHAAGWGVIIKEALANGRLADRDQDAIAAALANPWVDVVLSGAVIETQVRSNAGALGVHLSPDRLAQLSKLAEPPEQYWKERGQLAWH